LKSIWYSAGGRLADRILSDVLCRAECPDRRLFLTFDDGPSPELTLRVSDLLKAERLKATFFVRADRAIKESDVIGMLLNSGHEVGSHSFHHNDFWRSSRSNMVAALEKADAVLSTITGSAVSLIRPPYGHVRPALIQWCRSRGKTCVLWDVMPGDFAHNGSGKSLFKSVRPLLRNGSIVVLHDGSADDRPSAGLPDASAFSIEQNRRFEMIRELLECLKSDGWAMDKTIGSYLADKKWDDA
jgi:peptidoglycan/xylan/chitin deacetylase (PgdA/CDA1 family)